MKYERVLTTPAVRGPPKYSKYAPVWVAGESRTSEQSLNVTLEIRALSDAHILLKAAGSRIQYEIVIGGWRNSRSEIRRGQQGLPLGSLLHAKTGPLDPEKFTSCLLTVQRSTAGGGLIQLKWTAETIKVFDKKMPPISEIRVATGFGFSGDWRVLTDDGERENQTPETNVATGENKNSDTPSIVFTKKRSSPANETPFSAVLRRGPALRTPLSGNTQSPVFRTAPSGNSLASLNTVLGQFD